MNITIELRKKFVKDCKLPIKIYTDPYFRHQLVLFDKYYNCLDKYRCFMDSLQDFSNEEEYFAYYNKIKDNVMNYIKSNPYFIAFNECDMSEWLNWINKISKYNLPSKDIFKESCIGRRFLSIDMIKANFNVLKYYNANIFDNAETYEDFISKFTDNEHIINSKYIREVIFGNCNPKRQITYEKSIMAKMVLSAEIDMNKIVFFSNDEVIFDITDMTNEEIDTIKQVFNNIAPIPLRFEDFILKVVYKDNEDIAYIKELNDGTITIKKYQSFYLPIIIKTIKNAPIVEEDLIFEYNGNLCKLIETPKLYIK